MSDILLQSVLNPRWGGQVVKLHVCQPAPRRLQSAILVTSGYKAFTYIAPNRHRSRSRCSSNTRDREKLLIKAVSQSMVAVNFH